MLHARGAGLTVAAILAVVALAPPVPAVGQITPALTAERFTEIALQGFGDRQNSWAWSMAWFRGNLYVGTLRSYECLFSAAINLGTWHYPPSDPDIECPPDPRDLQLQAEIWSWSPESEAWTLVFRSPRDVPMPGANTTIARDVGFRGMHVFREPDGTEALYVGACSARMLDWRLPGARLLRSTDGVTFTPVPQMPGTFLGDLHNACFRGLESHGGKLYLLAGSFQGEGVVIESADPKRGDTWFRQVTPEGAQAYEIASFNGFLYVSFSHELGFGLYKTSAQGALPYQFTPILSRGGFQQPTGDPTALSMKVFRGSLYVGSDSVRFANSVACTLVRWYCESSIIQNDGSELFRVDADDTWALVVGQSRSTPVGYKRALSGLGRGFNWMLNQHFWRLEVFDGRLYVGTYDVATELRNGASAPVAGPWQGFDLWYTEDGQRFFPVDVRGFGDPFNYGVRTLQATPAGLFLGSANPYYGLRLYRGVPAPLDGPQSR